MSPKIPPDHRPLWSAIIGAVALCLVALIAIFVSRTPTRPEEKVTIAAAADLKFAMDEIVASFRKEHPGDRVDVIYGSSGKLQTQIRQGAPYDVFFSADIQLVRDLKTAGETTTGPRVYAVGRIVLWSATRDATGMTLASLADPAIRTIAIANPKHAPYGRRAEEALRSAGLWDRVQDKLIFGENIAQTAQYVQSGAADAGIIALSLAVNKELASKGGYWLVPDRLHSPLEQAYAITRHGKDNALASAFASYMETPAARQIMTRHGFAMPGSAPAD